MEPNNAIELQPKDYAAGPGNEIYKNLNTPSMIKAISL
jgi:hypothetical protein